MKQEEQQERRVNLKQEDREFLAAVEKYGGEASTRQIREETGWSADKVKYRFRRLERLSLIEVRKDNSLTKTGVAAMRVAVLTEEGRREIEEGATRNTQVKEKKTKEENLEERIDELEAEIEGFRRNANMNIVPLVEALIDAVDESEGVVKRRAREIREEREEDE